jgi:hypothetical protein
MILNIPPLSPEQESFPGPPEAHIIFMVTLTPPFAYDPEQDPLSSTFTFKHNRFANASSILLSNTTQMMSVISSPVIN